jgi:hypothetical protein
MKLILNNIILTVKIIKKASIVWLIPLLLIIITLLNSFWMNKSYPVFNYIVLLKIIGGIAAIAFVFTVVLVVIKRVFLKTSKFFLLEVKTYFIPVLTIIMTMLFFSIIIKGGLSDLFFKSSKLLWFFWNYLLTFILSIFFYYILHNVIDTATTVKKSFVDRIRDLFSWKIVIELLVMAFLASVITTPFYYYSFMKFSEAFEERLSSSLFLALLTQYRSPLWYVVLSWIFKPLIHTFLIVHTAVLYYGHEECTNLAVSKNNSNDFVD